MRPIKFRGWDRLDGKMRIVDEISFKNSGYVVAGDATLPIVNLMQFTGLLDKNGKEIYEGDIVRNGAHGTSEIFFTKGSFCTYVDDRSWLEMSQNSFDFEIIGNIHENPDLLK